MLPFPMNINAPQPESPERIKKPDNYLSFETSPQVHRRRATLPSMVLSHEDATTLHKIWSTTDLTPVGSADGTSPLGVPSPPVAMAIPSQAANPNRRSRSAGALHELAKRQERISQLRSRSSEIEKWRASKIDSQQDMRQSQMQTQTQESTPVQSPRASSTGAAMTEVSEALAETGSSVADGDLGIVEYASVAGEPVESVNTQELSMEQRLAQLEGTMHRLSMSFQDYNDKDDIAPPKEREFALKSGSRALTPQINFAPPTPSRQASTSHVADAPHQNPSMRFTQPMRSIPSPSPSKGSSTYQQSHQSSTIAAAPGSPQASFLQPSAHFPPAPSSVHSAPQAFSSTIPPGTASPYITQQTLQEHLTPLHNALRYERQIRKTLESQVASLSRDVADLSALVAQMRKQAAYASQATIHASPGSPRRGSPVKGFPGLGVNGAGGERSRFSGYDSTDEDTDVERPMRSPGENWMTPREEQFGMF